MMQCFWLLLLLVLCNLSISYEQEVETDPSLLFIGYTNTFYGSVLPGGFVKIVENESKGRVSTVALPYSNTSKVLAMLKHEEVSSAVPSKVFFIVEADAILSHLNDEANIDTVLSTPISRPHPIMFELDSVLALLKSRGSEVHLCCLLLSGDNMEETQLEMHFGDWRIALMQTSHDFEVSFMDFSTAFAQYVEVANIDNLPHSVLTHEGNILNENGHLLVANEILKGLGFRNQQKAVNLSIQRAVKKESAHADVLKMKATYNPKSAF